MTQVIHVKKKGDVYQVFVDPVTNQPKQLAGIDDEPVDAFPFTLVGIKELQASFPGRTFLFHEAPKPKENTVVPSVEIKQEAASILGGKAVESPKTPQPKQVISVDQNVIVNFLKRLQTAHKYATKKAQRELEIKIETVEELMRDLYGGKSE